MLTYSSSLRPTNFRRSLGPIWRAASIHYWHCLTTKTRNEATRLLDLSEADTPSIAHEKIHLWDGRSDLGIVPLGQVMKEHLGPGKMLALKGEPAVRRLPTDSVERAAKLRLAAPQTYEILRFPTTLKQPKKNQPITGGTKGFRAREIRMTVKVTASYLRHELQKTYQFLARSELFPAIPTSPVEIHIHNGRRVKTPSSVRDWAFYARGRFDLHPAVMLRALPEGVLQLGPTLVSPVEGDLLFLVTTQSYSRRPGGKTGRSLSTAITKKLRDRQDWVSDLIPFGGASVANDIASF